MANFLTISLSPPQKKKKDLWGLTVPNWTELSIQKRFSIPALLASASSKCISVQSASQCSRHMWRNRAWVLDTLLSSDNSATVCSHSFQPLNQSVKIPTWSRNIMANPNGVLSRRGFRERGRELSCGFGNRTTFKMPPEVGGVTAIVLQSTQELHKKKLHMVLALLKGQRRREGAV